MSSQQNTLCDYVLVAVHDPTHVGILHVYYSTCWDTAHVYAVFNILCTYMCSQYLHKYTIFLGGDAAPPSNSSNSGKKRFIEVP